MSKPTLYGNSRVSEDQVRAVIPPEETRSWKPISHNRFLTTVDELLKENNFHVIQKQYQLGYEDNRMFSTYMLNGDTSRPDYGLSLGLRNSTDKCFPAGIAIGTEIFVCSNLMFNGDLVITHKHTTNINEGLANRLNDAIMNIRESQNKLDNKIEFWKDRTVKEKEVSSFLWDVGNTGVLPFSFLKNKVFPLYENPLYKTHGEGTIWTLHNAFSEGMKERRDNNPQAFNNESQGVIQMINNRWAA